MKSGNSLFEQPMFVVSQTFVNTHTNTYTDRQTHNMITHTPPPMLCGESNN